MDEEIRECWWELIFIIADELEALEIKYSFDSSTSLFVHGIEFNMDDIDITVEWKDFFRTYDYFKKYEAGPIIKRDFFEFEITINCFKIHVVSSEKINNIEDDCDRVMQEREGHILWSKTPQCYRRRIALDHPLADLIDVYMEK